MEKGGPRREPLCFEVPEEVSLGQIQVQGLQADKCQVGPPPICTPISPANTTWGWGMLGGHSQADRRAGVFMASSLGGVQR